MEIGSILGIISVIFCIATFVVNRRDKAVKDTREQDNENSDQKLIGYRLDKVEEKLDKILDKLDGYDKEVKNIVDEALDQHIKIYHRGDK
jgi:hypothetical protein